MWSSRSTSRAIARTQKQKPTRPVVGWVELKRSIGLSVRNGDVISPLDEAGAPIAYCAGSA
ncbi:MAG TPA: hypothetical protein VK477_12815, partial [Acidobacteriota bacterium]|nr:hypothetical protein [Acidobacteriota bacterium]